MSKACDHPAMWRILHPDKTAYACEGHLTTLRGPKLAYSTMLEPGTGIACDWKGEGVSESKAEYYAKHLEALASPEVQPTSLPTLLARMVGEYTKELCLHISSDISGGMALAFNRTLLESAQPALTAYLEQLTTPPKFVVREQQEDISERRRTSMYGAYLLKCKERDLVPFSYDEWLNIGNGPKTK